MLAPIGIFREPVDPSTLSLQQSKAVVIGTQVIYITYDALIDMQVSYLIGEFEE